MTKSFISDPGVSCLLAATMKLFLANLIACKEGKTSNSSLNNWNVVNVIELLSLFLDPLDLHTISFILKSNMGTSLVAQWLSIRLPMQGTRVRALVREHPTCRGATKPVRHNYWACALEPASHNYWAHAPQLLKPAHLEPMLCNKRSPHTTREATATRESPRAATDPTQPKINLK